MTHNPVGDYLYFGGGIGARRVWTLKKIGGVYTPAEILPTLSSLEVPAMNIASSNSFNGHSYSCSVACCPISGDLVILWSSSTGPAIMRAYNGTSWYTPATTVPSGSGQRFGGFVTPVVTQDGSQGGIMYVSLNGTTGWVHIYKHAN